MKTSIVLNRFFVVSLLSIALCALLAFIPKSNQLPSQNQFLLGGIQVNEPDHNHWVNALKQSEMNTVSVTVYAKQGDWDSDNFWYEDSEPAVISEIRAAKEAGLNVVLIMRVALDHAFPRNKYLWHGMIAPKDKPTLLSWCEKYSRFILKWAKIAEEERVDVFAIGSEMKHLTATLPVEDLPALENWYLDEDKQQDFKERILDFESEILARQLWTPGSDGFQQLGAFLDARQAVFQSWARTVTFHGADNQIEQINANRALKHQFWSRLVEETRKHFSGQLTYAANFDNYHEVAFWPDLDAMGINAYFPLRKPTGATLQKGPALREMTASWLSVLESIGQFQRDQQMLAKPVIFTELGYTFRKNCTIEPWGGFGFSVVGNYGNTQLMAWERHPIDYTERALAVKALHKAHSQMSNSPLSGILYWKLSSFKQHEGVEPFVMHLRANAPDPLQVELAQFVE